VFVVIHRRLPEFEGRAKLKTWIYRIVANTVLNQARLQRRKAPHSLDHAEVDPEQLAAAGPGPELNAGRVQAAELARAIVMGMAEPNRMAFVLVELEGMSYGEAATALDETFDTVCARVRAARIEFARQARRLQSLPGGA
jgi:RNA polymerase sigma-70 factor (ECF subfamily)